MQNPLGGVKSKLKKLGTRFLATTALAVSLLNPLQAKADQGITIPENYSTYNWNIPRNFYDSNSNAVTKNSSHLILNANNLQVPINNLKFYSAGTLDPTNQLYRYNDGDFIPITNVRVSNNQGTTWQVQSITNLGRYPNIFGLEKMLLFLEKNPTNSNYDIRIDKNVRVFDRDIYEVNLAATNGVATNNFTLDLELITDEANTTNNNETATFAVLHSSIVNNGTTNYYGYVNRVFGKMGNKIDISKQDSNNNGIANSYEATYSPSPTNMNANSDEDNDGANNLQEYNSGTNPTNSNSVFKVTSLETTTNSATINWQGPLQNFFYEPITYNVYKKTDLNDTNNWENLATNLNTRVYSDTNSNERAFYKVEAKSPEIIDLPPNP